MYHRVHPDSDTMTVAPDRFEAQMNCLRKLYEPVSMSTLVQHLRAETPLPERAVVVTFDDGYRDNYVYALPILAAYEIPAIFYVTSGQIDTQQYFWWDLVRHGLRADSEVGATWPAVRSLIEGQRRERQVEIVTAELKKLPWTDAKALMARICVPVAPPSRAIMSWDELRALQAAGMEIGGHTVTHPILSQQTHDEAAWEIRHCKEQLEAELGAPVRHFAYPNGQADDFSTAIADMVAEAGYESAASTVVDFVTANSSLMALERIGIYGPNSLPVFLLKLFGLKRR